MRTYKQIHFSNIAGIMTSIAHGVAYVSGSTLPISDMIYSLSSLGGQVHNWNHGDKKPFYIAIRERGTESGTKEACIERCSALGYPIVIAKIEPDKTIDLNVTVMFTHNPCGDNTYMKQEFDSI